MRSNFGLLGCILNIDSPENHLAECSVRFIYIQHRAVLGCLLWGEQPTDELWVLTAWELFAIACTPKEVIANLIRLFVSCDCWRDAFGNDYNPSQQLWLDASENRSQLEYFVLASTREDVGIAGSNCEGKHRKTLTQSNRNQIRTQTQYSNSILQLMHS